MAIPALHHVQLAIPGGGEALARQFYGGVLGLEEVPKPENLQWRGGVLYRTGSLDMHLGADPSFVAATKAHVALGCADLRVLRRRLVAAGYEVVEDEPLPGFERFYTFDPFGNRVELLSAMTDQDAAESGGSFT